MRERSQRLLEFVDVNQEGKSSRFMPLAKSYKKKPRRKARRLF